MLLSRVVDVNADHYKVLGVSRDVDEETLKHEYRKLAFAWHPDQRSDDPQAEAMFRRINEAYAVLADPDRRRAYDARESLSPDASTQPEEEDDLWADDWSAETNVGGSSAKSAQRARHATNSGARIPPAPGPERVPHTPPANGQSDSSVPHGGRAGFWEDDKIPQSGRPGFWDS